MIKNNGFIWYSVNWIIIIFESLNIIFIYASMEIKKYKKTIFLKKHTEHKLKTYYLQPKWSNY